MDLCTSALTCHTFVTSKISTLDISTSHVADLMQFSGILQSTKRHLWVSQTQTLSHKYSDKEQFYKEDANPLSSLPASFLHSPSSRFSRTTRANDRANDTRSFFAFIPEKRLPDFYSSTTRPSLKNSTISRPGPSARLLDGKREKHRHHRGGRCDSTSSNERRKQRNVNVQLWKVAVSWSLEC